MENASKALLIAGGVLLAMMIIGIGIFLYNRFSNTTESYVARMDLNEITKFNSNFEVFQGRDDITAQEIVSLINMVEEYDKKTYINVTIEVNNGVTTEEHKNGWKDGINNSIKFLQDYSFDDSNNTTIDFKCTLIVPDSDNNGIVKLIKFEKT